MNKLNLFFSYGHDETTNDLIFAIKHFFEGRGHTVWIDQKNIEEASDWRRRIITGLENSDTVLAFLSQKSIGKKDGVCLDELRISVSIPGVEIVSVLLEEENSLDIPCTISRNQYIDMSAWKKFINTPKWADFFKEKMEHLAEFLESDEHFKLQGEIDLLKNFLLPDVSNDKYYSLLSAKQIGRKKVSYEFDKWLSSDEKYLFLIGKLGSGKSHFVAHKSHYNPDILAAYFFEFNNEKMDSIKMCIRSLCFQIASKMPDFRHWIMKEFDLVNDNNAIKSLDFFNKSTERELFFKLISDPFMKTIYGNQGNKCIILDAIDELPAKDMNNLMKLISQNSNSKTPRWVKFVISCRNKEKLNSFIDECQILELDVKETREDIIEYLIYRLGDNVSTREIEFIADRSECMFIYAEKFCDAYASGMVSLDKVPRGISSLYQVYFEKIFTDLNYNSFSLPLTVIACDNTNTLTEKIFKKIFSWDSAELAVFLDVFTSFVSLDNSKEKRLKFCHKSVVEWLTNREINSKFSIDLAAGYNLICAFCEKELNATDLDYSTMKFIYQQLKLHGSGSQKSKVITDYKFLYTLLTQAQIHSDIATFKEVYELLEDTVKYGLGTSEEAFIYFYKAYFLNCQLEIIKGNIAEARIALEQGKKQFEKYLEVDTELQISVEENYIWTIKDVNPVFAEGKINKLIENAQKKTFNNKPKTLSNLYYIKGVILYKKREFAPCFDSLITAKRIAENMVDQPGNHLIRIINQLGWVCCRLKKYDDAIDLFRDSLKMRISEYGNYSHYTALAYDALARAYLLKAKHEISQLPIEALTYAKDALNINNSIFGENNRHSARNLYTLAMIGEYSNKINEAIEYAKTAYNIYLKHNDTEGINEMNKYLDGLLNT